MPFKNLKPDIIYYRYNASPRAKMKEMVRLDSNGNPVRSEKIPIQDRKHGQFILEKKHEGMRVTYSSDMFKVKPPKPKPKK